MHTFGIGIGCLVRHTKVGQALTQGHARDCRRATSAVLQNHQGEASDGDDRNASAGGGAPDAAQADAIPPVADSVPENRPAAGRIHAPGPMGTPLRGPNHPARNLRHASIVP